MASSTFMSSSMVVVGFGWKIISTVLQFESKPPCGITAAVMSHESLFSRILENIFQAAER